jgi:hypoxanthine-guanine phosphoribosyltransferase
MQQEEDLGYNKYILHKKKLFQYQVDLLKDTSLSSTKINLVLIDDVVTTGTTANLLARLLKQHGVTSLSLWTLAVTPNADHSSA